MRILLHGTNNYLAERLVEFFLSQSHEVTCVIRDENAYLKRSARQTNLRLVKADIIREKYPEGFPANVDVSYYFSLYAAEQGGIYQELELLSLKNYIKKLRQAHCQHLIYVLPLRSPVNKEVKRLLKDSYIAYTVVRTSNIVGKESLLLQIFKKMGQKLFIISNQRLAKSRCQPIALRDAISYLDFIAFNPATFNQSFDIGGSEILNYKEMLDHYLSLYKIRKTIIVLPFVNNIFASFWLSRSSGLPKPMAKAFSANIQGDLLCEDNRIHRMFPHEGLTFKEALLQAID